MQGLASLRCHTIVGVTPSHPDNMKTDKSCIQPDAALVCLYKKGLA